MAKAVKKASKKAKSVRPSKKQLTGAGKPEHYVKLGRRIKALRLSKGYQSAEAFALDNGLSRTHYGRWESGTNITYDNLLMLIDIFGLSVKKFFSEGFD